MGSPRGSERSLFSSVSSPVLVLLPKGQIQVLLCLFCRYPWLFFGVSVGYFEESCGHAA